MSVISKWYPSAIETGRRGGRKTFSPVYEGSQDLQGLSENSIFGSASPGGHMVVFGDVDIFAALAADDELYVYLCGLGDGYGGDLLCRWVSRIAFESAPQSSGQVEFRFSGTNGEGLDVSMSLTIANPAAIAYLQEHTAFDTIMAKALPRRRSDREIELRRQALVQVRDGKPWGDDGSDARRSWGLHVAALERKLQRAEGLV